MHPNPRRIIPVIALVVLAALGYWFYTTRAAAQTAELKASGTIEVTQYIVAPEISGRVIEVAADEGDSITADQVLIKLDPSLLEAQHLQAEAALAATVTNYDSLRDGATAGQLNAAVARAEKDVLEAQQALDALHDTAASATAQAESEVAHARDVLDKAQQRLRNLHHPDIEFYQDRLQKAQDALSTAQENVQLTDIGSLHASLQAARDVAKLAEERLGKVQTALGNCTDCDPKRVYAVDGRPLTLDDAQDNYNDALNRVKELELKVQQAERGNTQTIKDAQDTLDDAKRDLGWALQGPDTIDVAVAQADVDLAEAKLAEAQTHYDKVKSGLDPDKLAAAEARLTSAQAAQAAAKAAAAPNRLDAAQAQMDAAKAALNLIEVQLSKLTIASPATGTVLSRAVEPGSVALPGSTLFVVADLTQLQITVYVPEDRYGTITLGQTAVVAVDSFPGETFTAAVTHIADAAEFTPRNVQTVSGRKTTVYAVKLSIANPDNKLKPGMPADVEFGK